jgi:hypothetical protein
VTTPAPEINRYFRDKVRKFVWVWTATREDFAAKQSQQALEELAPLTSILMTPQQRMTLLQQMDGGDYTFGTSGPVKPWGLDVYTRNETTSPAAMGETTIDIRMLSITPEGEQDDPAPQPPKRLRILVPADEALRRVAELSRPYFYTVRSTRPLNTWDPLEDRYSKGYAQAMDDVYRLLRDCGQAR